MGTSIIDTPHRRSPRLCRPQSCHSPSCKVRHLRTGYCPISRQKSFLTWKRSAFQIGTSLFLDRSLLFLPLLYP